MSNRPRNIRNTQYPVQIPVVTEEEFRKLTPELGAMILNTKMELFIGKIAEGKVVWTQIKA